jgi:cbb3-type cytochrome oxidase maturation protein
MEIVIYLLFPTLFFGLIVMLALFWAINNNQYDDLSGSAKRILHDDDVLEPKHHRNKSR